MANKMCRDYLYHGVTDDLKGLWNTGAQAFKDWKKRYNAEYYQQHKDMWKNVYNAADKVKSEYNRLADQAKRGIKEVYDRRQDIADVFGGEARRGLTEVYNRRQDIADVFGGEAKRGLTELYNRRYDVADVLTSEAKRAFNDLYKNREAIGSMAVDQLKKAGNYAYNIGKQVANNLTKSYGDKLYSSIESYANKASALFSKLF